MNENIKIPYDGKVYENYCMTISLPIKTDFLTADMLGLVENTVDFWLGKCKAESKYGKYKGTEVILNIKSNIDGEKRFTLEILGYFPDMLLSEYIDVVLTPELEEFYYNNAFWQLAENFATFGRLAE